MQVRACIATLCYVPIRIDYDSEEFPYEQLARILRERITAGEYPPGTRLPSLVAIQAETGLSPMTIRRAMRQLEAEGLVHIRPGRGTFAAKPG